MASLNTSTNGPSIRSSYQGVINGHAPSGSAANSPTYAQWALFSVSAPLVNAFQQDSGSKESVLKVQSTGDGELTELIEDFSEGRVQFAFVKVKDSNSGLPKYVLIAWCGEGVPERTKGYFTSHLAAISKILHGYHVQITARSERDLDPEGIVKKVADASGSKYSAGAAVEIAHEAAPAFASKPVFNPTRSGAGSAFNPLASNGSRQVNRDENVDEDGWGADAPQVSRSTVEKVQSAYKPTKVNMAELTKQREPSRYEAPSRPDTSPDVVRGGYQPIGKVDIAAIRAQAKKTEDDRPTIVKGAYEPVGKVDIAAIRAKAQKPADAPAPRPAASNNDEEEQAPRSLAERSAAFSQSERLTSLPKPKVAHMVTGTSTFSGTKPLTPGTFGLHQPGPQVAKSAPIGTASKTFADEGGKTPAQIWAEKKARERGETPGAAPSPTATPIQSQTSGNGGWKSGYAGKSWAPVSTHATGVSNVSAQRTGERAPSPEREEAPASPAGGIAALKDKFARAVPMGAPVISSRTGGSDAAPPPPPMASRPKSPEPQQEEDEDRGRPNIPSPPRVQRSPSPSSREQSPVRIAMPVSRSKEPEPLSPMEEPPAPVMPVRSLEKQSSREPEQDDEPARGSDPARAAAAAVAAGAFGGAAVGAGVGAAMAHHQQEDKEPQAGGQGGKRALVQYDYEKAEDNEIELVEGDYVTNIEMVDDDWWMGTNSQGESGLFPSNYVELVENDAATAPAPAAPARQPSPEPAPVAAQAPPPAPVARASNGGPTATALYDYEAAEDNELSFDENDKITDLEFPDDDWWFGHKGGKSGLFPSNYVQLDE